MTTAARPAARRLGPDDCRACRGTGQLHVMDGGHVVGFEECPSCKGTGAKQRRSRLERAPEEDL